MLPLRHGHRKLLNAVFGFQFSVKDLLNGGHGGPPHHQVVVRANLVFAPVGEHEVRPYGAQSTESEEKVLTSCQKQGKYGQAARPISTSRLHTLLRFYLWPINLVVYQGL